MAADADAVVVARVEQTMLGRTVPTTDDHVLPFTFVDLAVERVVAGSAPAHVTLEQTGGQLDDRSFFASGDGGPYASGERVLLFLKQQPDTGLYYLAHPKGRFLVEDGRLHAAQPDDPVARMLDLRPVADVHKAAPSPVGAGRRFRGPQRTSFAAGPTPRRSAGAGRGARPVPDAGATLDEGVRQVSSTAASGAR